MFIRTSFYLFKICENILSPFSLSAPAIPIESSDTISRKIYRIEKKPSSFKLMTEVKESRILLHCVGLRYLI
jgi:hypothetical protein